MKLLTLDADDVTAACPMRDCIEEMARVFALEGEGKVESPIRTMLSAPSGDILVMPSTAKRAKVEASVKVVSVFPKNKGIPSIHALTILVDAETGEPRAMLSGGALTAIRTGAVSGLSCRYLARDGSATLGIFGAGGMAYQQVNGVVSALPSVERVRIYSFEPERSRALARQCTKTLRVEATAVDSAEACVKGSDVVVTATTSKAPIFDGSLVGDGTHVIAMGSYRPNARELDSGLVSRASIFVDSREAVLEEAGDILIPIEEGRITKDSIKGELSELVSGEKRGRERVSEVTLFKCVGLALEDNAAGWLAYRRARKRGIGKWVEL